MKTEVKEVLRKMGKHPIFWKAIEDNKHHWILIQRITGAVLYIRKPQAWPWYKEKGENND